MTGLYNIIDNHFFDKADNGIPPTNCLSRSGAETVVLIRLSHEQGVSAKATFIKSRDLFRGSVCWLTRPS